MLPPDAQPTFAPTRQLRRHTKTMDSLLTDPNAIVLVDSDCICSLGEDLTSTWRNLSDNQSGVQVIDRYRPEEQSLRGLAKITYAAQIKGQLAELSTRERDDRWPDTCYQVVKLLVRRILTRLAFNVAHHDPQRIALLGATSLGSLESTATVLQTQRADSKYILNQCPNVPLSAAASEFGLQGPSFNVAGACASSSHAVLLAHHFISANLLDCALVVGFEFPIMPLAVAGMDWINALYRRDSPSDRAYDMPQQASRPFSKDRRGLVLGEGAGIIFLTRRAYAEKAGWPVQAIVRGGYANSDAYHLTRISTDNVALCISSALAAARCDADQISCINAHATSTPQGDAAELSALSSVFGERLKTLPVVANKSQIGHTLGAAGILAMIYCVQGMRHQLVLPTLNYVSDEQLPAAMISPTCLERRHDMTLVNAFGFGGTNVCMVLQRP